LNNPKPYLKSDGARSYRAGFVYAVSGLLLGLLMNVSSVRSATGPEPSETTAAIDSVLKQALPLKDKVVYVDFWASWCMPCRHSFPWMRELAARYADKGLQIITVSLDKKHADAEKFLHETQSAFHVIYDSTGTLAKLFKVDAMPTSFLYGRDGRLHSRHRGFEQDKAGLLDSTINALIREGAGK
jgi:cytochrome c biogenesis protein CcmG/thiol:disulfide interchange protein DsbE